MPTALIRSMARRANKSVSEVEALWEKAKGVARDKKFREDSAQFYSYATGVLKQMLGLPDGLSRYESAAIRLLAARNPNLIYSKRSSIFKIPGIWVSKVEDSTAIARLAYDPIKLNLYVAFKGNPSDYYVYTGCSVKQWFTLARSQSKGRVVQELKDSLENVGVLTITGSQT